MFEEVDIDWERAGSSWLGTCTQILQDVSIWAWLLSQSWNTMAPEHRHYIKLHNNYLAQNIPVYRREDSCRNSWKHSLAYDWSNIFWSTQAPLARNFDIQQQATRAYRGFIDSSIDKPSTMTEGSIQKQNLNEKCTIAQTLIRSPTATYPPSTDVSTYQLPFPFDACRHVWLCYLTTVLTADELSND